LPLFIKEMSRKSWNWFTPLTPKVIAFRV